MNNTYEENLKAWNKKEKDATELSSLATQLWFDKSVELIIFRRPLVDARASEILNHHLYAQRFLNLPLDIEITLALTKAIAKLELSPSRIDMGRLGSEWLKEKTNYANEDAFIADKLNGFIGADKFVLKPKDVILYGFGRIGRIAARILVNEAGKGEQLRLRAIVTRSNSDEDIKKRASLLRKDSIHGKFHGTVVEDLENKTLIINGHTVQMLAINKPEEADYTKYGINEALVIDNTGVTRDREGLSKHLLAKGVSQVLLTAPGKGDIPNIVHGINHETFDPSKENIFSAASCTTNAVVPIIKVVEDAFGINHGHLETVHSYTNDQNLLDNFHKKYRRGRSAALNMVITETGAASAVTKVMPNMSGKFTGNAIRVPTPDVSLAILNLSLKSNITVDSINEVLKNASTTGNLVEQIDYSLSNELVSTDCIGNTHCVIVDAPATIVAPDGKSVVLYCWYDNEFGYTKQVVRLAKYLSGVIRLRYY
ncbi:MAG: glyceraldehyde-3-phosphate dehydrogenase [Fimbriimonadaceae bacterium]|nr:glyceraldehyde-3-phosphate dehydrogenase [Chitinophagales bacterium]